MAAGLGPLLFRALGDRVDALTPQWQAALLSADLTARVRFGQLLNAALDVLEICDSLGLRATLLKGISISTEHYPAGHLRPMTDIDILVPKGARETVESRLVELGYVPKPNYPVEKYDKHGVPLCQPETRAWVEIHSSLFAANKPLGASGIFAGPDRSPHVVESELCGRRVNRLTNAFQLAYLSSAWVQDLARSEDFHPSFLVPLFDAVYLIHASEQELDWDSLIGKLDNEAALTSLYILLTYLKKHGLWLPPKSTLSRLAARQGVLGRLDLRFLHALLDRYLLRGRPFTKIVTTSRVLEAILQPGEGWQKLASLPWWILFPPSSPDRYSLRYQLARVPSLLRRFGLLRPTAPRRP
jgi:hypothetical protein